MSDYIEYKYGEANYKVDEVIKVPFGAKIVLVDKFREINGNDNSLKLRVGWFKRINAQFEIGDKVTTSDDFDGSGYNEPTKQVIGIIDSMLPVDDDIRAVVKSNKNGHCFVIEFKYLIKIE